MALRDYYRCKNCDAKVVYGPNRSEEDWEPYLLCRDCIAQLERDLATAREQLARINDALALSLPPIEDWARAYPKESFPEPDMDNVRRMLGDSLLSVVSADAMRHVITRVWELLEPVRTAQAIDSGLKP